MTYAAPFLAGVMAGMIVGSFVLHWLIGLAQVISSRSSKPGGQVLREALILSIANSGFWILVVTAYVAYHLFSGPADSGLIAGAAGSLSAFALLGVIAYGFARGGAASLLTRFAESMRRKHNFLRLNFAIGIIIAAPFLYEWFGQGFSPGFVLFVAIAWAAGIYFTAWYIWLFAPWDKPGLVRNKKDGKDNAA
jgi:hypothetical protein